MIRRLLVLIGVCLLVPVVFAQETDDRAAWNTLSAGNVRLQYPPGWAANGDQDSGIVLAPVEATGLTVTVTLGDYGQIMGLTPLQSVLRLEFGDALQDQAIITTPAGDALFSDVIFEADGIRSLQYRWVYGTKGLTLESEFAPAAHSEAEIEAFITLTEAIIGSVRIDEPIPGAWLPVADASGHFRMLIPPTFEQISADQPDIISVINTDNSIVMNTAVTAIGLTPDVDLFADTIETGFLSRGLQIDYTGPVNRPVAFGYHGAGKIDAETIIQREYQFLYVVDENLVTNIAIMDEDLWEQNERVIRSIIDTLELIDN